MKKLQSPSNSSYRARRLYRLGYRLRFLAADCICALATASVLLVVLTSCAPTQYIPLPEHHRRDSTHLSVYTRADSIREYVSDSMSIRFAKGVVPAAQRYTVPSGRYTSEVSSAGGNGIPDTVYIDRWHTAYRDRWHTLNHTDTIRVTRIDTISIAVPCPSTGKGCRLRRERGFIPRVYRYSLWFVILFLLYWLFRIAKAVYLRR